MKFFWKIFFTVMIISTLCLAIGGYSLMSSNFKALLDKEVQTAYDYGDIVYYSLGGELMNLPMPSTGEELAKAVEQVARSISINNTNQKIPFRLLNETGTVIFNSLELEPDKNILAKVSDSKRGWTLKELGGRSFVQAVRPAVFHQQTIYIETLRNTDYIFESQSAQYGTLIQIIIGMFLVGGIVTWMVSVLLMRQVRSLSKATQRIAAGDFSQRVQGEGEDEFAQLSRNFNRMAETLEANIHQLKEEADKRELFVGAFSHELKTPLTSIIGYADTLRRRELSAERVHLCADYIFAEGRRLENLSMRLLDLIVVKAQDLAPVNTPIKQLFEEIHVILGPQLAGRKIDIIYQLEPALIPMEPDLMKTVFFNLIDNAKKAIEKGGTIRVTGLCYGDQYQLSVQDSGAGMEQEELNKIREAFYMVEKSRSRRQGGAGLGLAICDEIIRLHGFAMEFDSSPGMGTTVTVTMKGASHEQ